MILPCGCHSEMQDRLFGKGMREHNGCKPDKAHGNKPKAFRCTVCKKEKSAS